jgi:hypothetical protein
LSKDKTFFFLSFEAQTLNGTGFNVTGRNGFGFTTFTPPTLLATSPNLGLSNLPGGHFRTHWRTGCSSDTAASSFL